MKTLNISFIGLDTSHAKVFTRLLADSSHEYYAPRHAAAVAGYPGGSPDFKASISRVDAITKELRDSHGLRIVDSPEEAAAQADAIMLTAVDGRVHPELFRRIAPYGKPIFIDKPLAVSHAEACEIGRLAAEHGVAWMSASVRRFALALIDAMADDSLGQVTGVESFGPIEIIPSQPGWYWYGIHIVETVYAVLGQGCRAVTAASLDGQEVVTAEWKDGRIAFLRGNRHPNVAHGTLIHREKGSVHVDTAADGMRKYAVLLDKTLEMFRGGAPAVDPAESLEIIRFIEAVNESRTTGRTVFL